MEFYRLNESDGLFLFWFKEILVALLIFALFYLLSQFLKYILLNWVPCLTAVTRTELDDRILARITPPAALLVIFAGLYYSVHYLPLPPKIQLVSSGAIFIINVIIISNIAYRCIDELIKCYANFLTVHGKDGLDRQVIPLLEKIVIIILIGTSLIITLKHFNYDILSLITAFGIGSLAIGMAAKDTLAHMISGFTLMIDRPFRIGDRIQLNNGQIGDVLDIGLRSTRIKTLDNILLIIPNSDLCNTMVTNQAFPDHSVRGKINIGVSYNSDVGHVKNLLVLIALDIKEVLRNPAPEAFFVSFGDYALNFVLYFWVEEYNDLLSVTDNINCQIISRFSESEVEIPFPIRTIYMEKDK